MRGSTLTIHTDGGSRGNPGPAACGFIVEEENKILHKGSKYLGKATNNFAEYQGVILALNWIKEYFDSNHGNSLINFYLDSELVVKQLNGLYKIKNDTIKMLVDEISETLSVNKIKVIFKHIPREQNKIADLLVNKELDNNA